MGGDGPLSSLSRPPISFKHILPLTPLVPGTEPEALGHLPGLLSLSWEVCIYRRKISFQTWSVGSLQCRTKG